MHRRPTPGPPLWAEEFAGPPGSPPDPGVWTHDVGAGGWGCGQTQRYTASPANAALTGDGRLRITARRPSVSGEVTSARLVTRDRFTVRYGRVAARMRVPDGAGLWSAFWMLGEDIGDVGWPACGEIDVMEHVTSDLTAVHGTLHAPGHSGLTGGVGRRHDHGGPLSDAFHVYAVDWSPERITWLLDDAPYSTLTPDDLNGAWPFTHPFFLLVNLAVGGSWPGLAADGPPTVPAALEVDWVRVWEWTAR